MNNEQKIFPNIQAIYKPNNGLNWIDVSYEAFVDISRTPKGSFIASLKFYDTGNVELVHEVDTIKVIGITEEDARRKLHRCLADYLTEDKY